LIIICEFAFSFLTQQNNGDSIKSYFIISPIVAIKQKTKPTPSDIKHFSILEQIKNVQVGEGSVVCMAKEVLPLSDKHRIIPLWAI
jgi:hypothetical protein